MSTRVATLHRLRAQRRDIDDRIDDMLRANWPVGAPIAWKRSGLLQRGTVLQHGYGARIKVRNERTGRELWIADYDVENAGAAN